MEEEEEEFAWWRGGGGVCRVEEKERSVQGGEEEGPACAFHGSAGLSCALTGCVWVLPDLCPWEEAHTSTVLPPSAAFKLKNKNDTEK